MKHDHDFRHSLSDETTRAAERTRVLMTGTLLTADGVQKIRVRDISAMGAQILPTSGIPKNCDAVFKRGSLFVPAHVVWSNSREAGLRFYRELSAQELEDAFKSPLKRVQQIS